MAPIHWLRFIKKIKTDIDGHYILKNKEYFIVFTSKPVNGLECCKISAKNIKGKEESQYLATNSHRFDDKTHVLTQPSECHTYYDSHKNELYKYEQKLSDISETE